MNSKFYIILIALLIFISGCKDNKPESNYKYIVFVGGDLVQVGYKTDNYTISGNFIIFNNSKGIKMAVPIINIASIEER